MNFLIKIFQIFIVFLILGTQFQILHAQQESEELGWPRKIAIKDGEVIIYQPQVESLTENKLESRAAISVKNAEYTSPVFGAMWFECRISTDRDERTVSLIDVKVTAAKFPEVKEENVNKLITLIETEVPKASMMPPIVLPSLAMVRNNSPGRPSS